MENDCTNASELSLSLFHLLHSLSVDELCSNKFHSEVLRKFIACFCFVQQRANENRSLALIHLIMNKVGFRLGVFSLFNFETIWVGEKLVFILLSKFEVLRTEIYFGMGFDALFRCLHRVKRTCASFLNVV